MTLTTRLDEVTPPVGKVLAVGLETGLTTPLALELSVHLAQTLRPTGRSVVYVEATYDSRTVHKSLPPGDRTLDDLQLHSTETEVLAAVRAWSAAGIGIVRDTTRYVKAWQAGPGAAVRTVTVLKQYHDWVVVALPAATIQPAAATSLALTADRILWQAGGWRKEGSLLGLEELLRAGVDPTRIRLTSIDGAGAQAAAAEGWETLDVVPHQLSWPVTRESLVALDKEKSEPLEWLEYALAETTGETPGSRQRNWKERWTGRRHSGDPDTERALEQCLQLVAYTWETRSENELAEWLQEELGNRVDTLPQVLEIRGWTGLHGLKETVELTRLLTR